MPRSYLHISEYEEEIIRLKGEGLTGREISERLGFSLKQYKGFITRYNEKQRKIAAGIAIKKKGRPPKDYQVSKEDKVAQLRYIIDIFSRSQKGSEEKRKISGDLSPQRKIYDQRNVQIL